MATASQLKRIEREYSEIAGEKITIEQVGSTIYAFGSEPATLRLFRKMPNMRQGFSENMNTFFFSIEMPR